MSVSTRWVRLTHKSNRQVISLCLCQVFSLPLFQFSPLMLLRTGRRSEWLGGSLIANQDKPTTLHWYKTHNETKSKGGGQKGIVYPLSIQLTDCCTTSDWLYLSQSSIQMKSASNIGTTKGVTRTSNKHHQTCDQWFGTEYIIY